MRTSNIVPALVLVLAAGVGCSAAPSSADKGSDAVPAATDGGSDGATAVTADGGSDGATPMTTTDGGTMAAASCATSKFSLGVAHPLTVPIVGSTQDLDAADVNAVAAGDLNGDGKADLVVGIHPAVNGTIAAFLNKGDGTFGAPTTSPNPGQFATQWINLADMDGDGKLDILGGGNEPPAISRGNGDGTFGLPTDVGFPVCYGTPEGYDQVVADLNSDGNVDIAITGCNGFGVALGSGKGVFTGAVNYDTRTAGAANAIVSLAAGDFNGDGKPDLAGGDWVTKSVRVFMNNGSGSFSPMTGASYVLPSAVTIADGEKGGDHTAVGDFNGDGKPDLAVTSAHAIDVLLNKGDGTFGAAHSYEIGGDLSMGGLVAADLNHDGKADLAVASHGGTVVVFMNNGDGTFPVAPTMLGAGAQLWNLVAADFTGTGLLGLATVDNKGLSASTPSLVDVFVGACH